MLFGHKGSSRSDDWNASKCHFGGFMRLHQSQTAPARTQTFPMWSTGANTWTIYRDKIRMRRLFKALISGPHLNLMVGLNMLQCCIVLESLKGIWVATLKAEVAWVFWTGGLGLASPLQNCHTPLQHIDRSLKAKKQSILCKTLSGFKYVSACLRNETYEITWKHLEWVLECDMPGLAPDGLFAEADRNPILALLPLQTSTANMRSLPRRPQVGPSRSIRCPKNLSRLGPSARLEARLRPPEQRYQRLTLRLHLWSF